MTADLESLYEKYVDYVTRLHSDLDRTVGQDVSMRCRVPLQSYEEFCRTWCRWGRTEGLQETWQQRFDLGYDRAAAEFCKRLEAALTGESHTAAGPSNREAA